MNNSKHHSNNRRNNLRASHQSRKKGSSKNTLSLAIFKIFLIIIVAFFLCYLGYIFLNKDSKEIVASENINNIKVENISENNVYSESQDIKELTKSSPEMASISDTFKVTDADYLEFLGIQINSNSEISTIFSQIKNTSDKSYSNINLRIFIFDDKKNVINQLDYQLDDIKPQTTIPNISTSSKNLSNCSYYSVKLIK